MEEYIVKVYDDSTKYWYQNGKLHRLDGPAVEYLNGTKKWYKEGQLHRLDGPAIECANGAKYWYIKGQELSKQGFNAKVNPITELTLDQIAEKFNIPVQNLKIKK